MKKVFEIRIVEVPPYLGVHSVHLFLFGRFQICKWDWNPGTGEWK